MKMKLSRYKLPHVILIDQSNIEQENCNFPITDSVHPLITHQQVKSLNIQLTTMENKWDQHKRKNIEPNTV